MRCEISFFTENNEADLPSSLSTTVGWMPPEPDTDTRSMEPPATDRKGRTPSKTSSTGEFFRVCHTRQQYEEEGPRVARHNAVFSAQM